VGSYLSLAKQAAKRSKEDSSFSSSNNLQKDSNKNINKEKGTLTTHIKNKCEKSELSELSQETACHHGTPGRNRGDEGRENGATNLRTTSLSVVPCIHEETAETCAVCSGYVRWLVEDEDRLRAAQVNPEKVRREFRAVRGGKA
jgi:hypothetical protein